MTEEHTIIAAGVATRVLTAGDPDAPPLLLLHDGGWGAAADMSWERMIPALETRYRILAPDMIGFGETEKVHHFARSGVEVRLEHVLAVLDHFAVDSAAFVGNSFGGTISLRGLCDPAVRARMSAVVSITGTGGPWKTPKALSELVRFDGTRVDMERIVGLLGLDAGLAGYTDYVDRRLSWSHVPGHYETMTAARVSVPDVMSRPGPSSDVFPAQLAGVETRLLLISGEQDDLLDPLWARHIAEVLPTAQVTAMPSGHCPNITMPAETAELIDGFLSKTPARTAPFPSTPTAR